MLTDKADQVQQDIEALKQARSNQKERELFQDRRDILRDLADDLSATAQKLKTLVTHGVSVGYDGANVEEALAKVRKVRSRFDENPEWIIENRNDLSDLKRRIRSHSRKIEKDVQSAWRTYFEEKVPDLSADVLDVFERFDDFADDVQTIRRCTRALQKWEETPPVTGDEFDTFETLVEKRKEIWQQLRSDDVPEEVIDFLVSAAGSDGATPKQYTDAVRTWLDDNDLHDRVRLHISN